MDRAFAVLLIVQWVLAVVVALFVSPPGWNWQTKQPHVCAALLLGAAIVVWPVFLALTRPGSTLTRHVTAGSQILFSCLFIYLTGGRAETQVHIFASLALLAIYRDWLVLGTASFTVASAILLGKSLLPQSMYALPFAEHWVESCAWLAGQGLFLVAICRQSSKEMRSLALCQAQLEQSQETGEQLVVKRTQELLARERILSTQYAVTCTLARAESLEQAAANILWEIGSQILGHAGTVFGAFWCSDPLTGRLGCIDSLVIQNKDDRKTIVPAQALVESKLPIDLLANGKLSEVLHLRNGKQPEDASCFSSGFAFPVLADGKTIAVVEFLTQEPFSLSAEDWAMIDSLGIEIGQFTVRKRSELVNQQLAELVRSSHDAIFGQDIDGRITSWNAGAEKLFGYGHDEIQGQSLSILMPPEKASEYDALTKDLQLSMLEALETVRQRKDGTLVEVSLTNSQVLDHNGTIVGISTIARDITERKEAEKRVSEFYSCVSHELRTPLTSIRGALGLIEGKVVEPDSQKAEQLISIARISADRLIRLINNILDLKKIEAGKMEMHMEELDPEVLIADALKTLRGLAQESSIELVQQNLSLDEIYADRDAMFQVLTNLVSNAIKFSHHGSQVRVVLAADNEAYGRISVIDKGMGIPADQMHRLFSKFQQVDSSDIRAQGGTGLGLAISKALVEQHGAQIGVTSSVEEGSTFWFQVPLRKKNIAVPLSLVPVSLVPISQVAISLIPIPERTKSDKTAFDTADANKSPL